jgi:hypothetical protein
MKRLRESLAFRSLEPCSSCDLEVPGGDLGVHGGVLGVLFSSADLILLQQRSRGKSGKVGCWTFWGGRSRWRGGGDGVAVDVRWMVGVNQDLSF